MDEEEDNKDMKEFSIEFVNFLLPHLQKSDRDSLMIAAILMKSSIELYTKALDDVAIFSLLDVIADSIPRIREQSVNPFNMTVH